MASKPWCIRRAVIRGFAEPSKTSLWPTFLVGFSYSRRSGSGRCGRPSTCRRRGVDPSFAFGGGPAAGHWPPAPRAPELASRLNAATHVVHPVPGNVLDPLLALHSKGERPQRMTGALGAMAGSFATTELRPRESPVLAASSYGMRCKPSPRAIRLQQGKFVSIFCGNMTANRQSAGRGRTACSQGQSRLLVSHIPRRL